MTAIYRLLLLHPFDTAPTALAHPARRPLHNNTPRTAGLLLLLALLNAVDLAYTLFAHKIGWLGEMNPLAETFLSQNLPSLIAFKILLVVAGSAMLWRLRRCPWAPAACWIVVAAYVTLAVLWYLWVREVTWSYETRLAFGF
jgi:hypothetical protein